MDLVRHVAILYSNALVKRWIQTYFTKDCYTSQKLMSEITNRMMDEATIYSQPIILFYFSQEKKSYICTHNIFYTHTSFKSIQILV